MSTPPRAFLEHPRPQMLHPNDVSHSDVTPLFTGSQRRKQHFFSPGTLPFLSVSLSPSPLSSWIHSIGEGEFCPPTGTSNSLFFSNFLKPLLPPPPLDPYILHGLDLLYFWPVGFAGPASSARILSSQDPFLQPGAFLAAGCWTPSPPEIGGKGPDPVGVIAYIMLSGRLPFRSEAIADLQA